MSSACCQSMRFLLKEWRAESTVAWEREGIRRPKKLKVPAKKRRAIWIGSNHHRAASEQRWRAEKSVADSDQLAVLPWVPPAGRRGRRRCVSGWTSQGVRADLRSSVQSATEKRMNSGLKYDVLAPSKALEAMKHVRRKIPPAIFSFDEAVLFCRKRRC